MQYHADNRIKVDFHHVWLNDVNGGESPKGNFQPLLKLKVQTQK